MLRRKYTATMRQTVVLEWPTQLRHGAHLFCVIAASVISRNVANQQILDAITSKDPAKAGNVLRHHTLEAKRTLLKALKEKKAS